MDYQRKSKMDQISSELTQKFIAALKEETLPWSKGYDVNYHPPFNPATGTVYKGASNVILLLNNIEKGYTDPRYLTFNNAKDLGEHVRRGEKGVTCIRIQPKAINLTDQEGKVILNEKGEPKQRELLIPCPYTVFNVAQIDDLEHVLKPLNSVAEKHQWDPHERAEALIKNSQAKIPYSEFRDIVEAPVIVHILIKSSCRSAINSKVPSAITVLYCMSFAIGPGIHQDLIVLMKRLIT